MKILDDRDLKFKVDHFKKYKEQIEYTGSVGDNIVNISLSMLDDNFKAIGGISGWKHFDFAYIEVVWIDKRERFRGFGSMLVHSFEERAKGLLASSILISLVEAINEQKFWLKQGYVETNRLVGIPKDSSVIYMFKSLKS